MATALIIDDERDITELIEMGLTGQSVQCDCAYNVKTAIRLLKENTYDVIFCDIRLPDGDGLDLLAHVQKHYAGTPVCMVTAHGNMDMAIRALKLGAFDFINKPFELKQLRAVCRAALNSRDGEPSKSQDSSAGSGASKGQRARQVELIGEAPVMEKVRLMIRKVSRSQAPVFIHGESGTGKEVAARSIHDQSSRKAGPFVAVNCGAIPENLVESEFFGYKKGAFTGANQDTDGLFVAANSGTLFLDEVADLPLAMQVKLLRAIQERAVRPIGGEQEESVDVRIISATHHNLADRVKRGEFREDLYYRLNVIGLTMPPLRKRDGDVQVLAHYLLAKLASNAGYPQAELSAQALDKLTSYAFPGNVRELENVLERALTFMEGEKIQAEDIHINLSLHPSEAKPASAQREVKASPPPVQEAPQPVTKKMSGSSQQPISVDELNFDEFVFDTDEEEDFSTPAAESSAMPEATVEVPDTMPDDLEEYMSNLEKKLLLKALKDAGNNKTKAAEALGISFRAMRYKLKKLGID